MEIPLMLVVVSFGFTFVHPNIFTQNSVDAGKVSEESEIQANTGPGRPMLKTISDPSNGIIGIPSPISDKIKLRGSLEKEIDRMCYLSPRLRTLFDSIAKNDLRKTDNYRKTLEGQAEKEQQAFDSMKEEMWFARHRNADREKDSRCNRYVDGEVPIVKRETAQNDPGPDEMYDEDYEISDESREPSGPKRVEYGDIFEAADKNDLDSVKHFVENEGVKVTDVNRDQQTIAHIAAKNANLTILKYAVAQNRTVLKLVDRWDQRVLHQAVNASALNVVKYLVEQCKLDPRTPKNVYFGDSSVHVAAMQGRLEVLKYFIEKKKLDANARNGLGEPPVVIAAERGHLEVVKYLVGERKSDPTQLDNNQGNLLFHSAMIDDIEVPKYLLDEKKLPLDVNWQDVFGHTAIFRAVRFNGLKFITYMVEEKKADMNLADKLNRTPVMEAVSEDKLAILKYFLGKGAKADIEELKKLATGKAVKKYLESRAPSRC